MFLSESGTERVSVGMYREAGNMFVDVIGYFSGSLSLTSANAVINMSGVGPMSMLNYQKA